MVIDAARRRPSERVRLGVVGLGAVAQAVHLPILERLRDAFVVTALCDLSPTLLATLGERYRVPPAAQFDHARAMLASGAIDAVAILSSGSHGSLTLDARRAGLPVFVEKPLAFTLAEADAIAGDPRLADGVEVGYMKLWDPAVRRAVAIVDRARRERGVAVRAIEVTVLHPSSERQLWQAHLLPPPSDLPTDALRAGAAAAADLRAAALGPAAEAVGPLYTEILLGSVVHELALIRAFDGDPDAIESVDTWPADAWPPSVGIVGRLPDGGRVTIDWHYLPDYAAYRELVRIVLDDATVELEFPSPYLINRPTSLTVTEPDGDARRDTVFTSVAEAFEEELLAFHRLVVTGERPLGGVAEGRADIVTCLRMARRYAERLGTAVGGEAALVAETGPTAAATTTIAGAR